MDTKLNHTGRGVGDGQFEQKIAREWYRAHQRFHSLQFDCSLLGESATSPVYCRACLILLRPVSKPANFTFSSALTPEDPIYAPFIFMSLATWGCWSMNSSQYEIWKSFTNLMVSIGHLSYFARHFNSSQFHKRNLMFSICFTICFQGCWVYSIPHCVFDILLIKKEVQTRKKKKAHKSLMNADSSDLSPRWEESTHLLNKWGVAEIWQHTSWEDIWWRMSFHVKQMAHSQCHSKQICVHIQ